MYDKDKIIPGIAIFLVLLLFPVWYNMGNAGPQPTLEKPKDATKCVEEVQYMRTTHMQMLDTWRDEVLRDGNRTQVTINSKKYEKSLMNGCMNCHTNKKKFCDECHQYASVKPYCWDCHFVPKETF